MRNTVKILTAGTLAFSLMIGTAFADGTVNGPKFELKASQLVVKAGTTFTVAVNLKNVQDLGAFQFKVKVEGVPGAKVESIVLDTQNADYPLTTGALNAVDAKGNRAGGAAMNGGKDVVSGHIGTVTISVPANTPASKLAISLDANKNETFLRDSAAGAINLAQPTAPIYVRVGDVAVQKKGSRKSSDR
jgi:hypothetical protein